MLGGTGGEGSRDDGSPGAAIPLSGNLALMAIGDEGEVDVKASWLAATRHDVPCVVVIKLEHVPVAIPATH